MVPLGQKVNDNQSFSFCNPSSACCTIIPPHLVTARINHGESKLEKYELKKIDAHHHHEMLQDQLKMINKQIKKAPSQQSPSFQPRSAFLNPQQLQVLKTVISAVIDYINELNLKDLGKEKTISENRAIIGQTSVSDLELENLSPQKMKEIVEMHLDATAQRLEHTERKKEKTIDHLYRMQQQMQHDEAQRLQRTNKTAPSKLKKKRSHSKLGSTPAHETREEHHFGRVAEILSEELKKAIDRIFNKKEDNTAPTAPAAPLKPAIAAAVYDAEKKDQLPGKLVFDNSFQTDDRAVALGEAVENAYQNTKKVLDFWKETFNIDFGRRADSVIHYMKEYVNAFFDGDRMVYGDGDDYFDAFYRYLNIAGHEMGHALVGDKLYYQGQSGALNESYADVLGACTDMFTDKISVEDYHFLVGKDLVRYKGERYPLRTFKEGPAYEDVDVLGGTDLQPDTMPPRSWYIENAFLLSQDQGGVHILSKIPNRVFYMIATAQNDWVEPMLFWKRVLDRIDNSRINFADFSSLQINLAREENNEELAQQLEQAWEKVGVKPSLLNRPFEFQIDELESALAEKELERV